MYGEIKLFTIYFKIAIAVEFVVLYCRPRAEFAIVVIVVIVALAVLVVLGGGGVFSADHHRGLNRRRECGTVAGAVFSRGKPRALNQRRERAGVACCDTRQICRGYDRLRLFGGPPPRAKQTAGVRDSRGRGALILPLRLPE